LRFNLGSYKRKNKLFVIIIIIHALFFAVKVILGNFFLNDSYEYWHLATNIKNSFEFYSTDINSKIIFENYTKRPPLYGLFILFSSFLLHSKITVLIFQNALSIISVFISLKLFNDYYKQINQKIYIAFFITSLSQFIYSNYIMSEILFQFFIIVLCYLFREIITKKSATHLFLFQITIVLLFLTKPIFYLFIIPNILLSFWFTKHVKRAYLFSLMPIIVFFLYINWNNQRTGSFEFSSIQNINLKNYNLYYFHVSKYGEEYALNINTEITEEANNKATYAKKQKFIKEKSLYYITKDWASYTLKHVIGSFRMFLDPGRFDIYNFLEFKNNSEVGFLKHLNENGFIGALEYFKKQPFLILIVIPVILLFNVFKIVGFILFWIKNHKKTPAVFWFMLFIITYFVVLTGIIGAARFLVPILPIYLLFATLGYSKRLK
tara:strand:+ start:2916 stop:4220 length:1305 start_codon:yes stop_codon:yes gene_type:complete